MTYFCFIPKVSDGKTLKISPPDWAAFRQTTEARHPVSVEVHDFDIEPLPADTRCWVLEARPRPGTAGVNRETIQQISHEIDAFIEPRKMPLPQAA
jgi:hypothetical protein